MNDEMNEGNGGEDKSSTKEASDNRKSAPSSQTTIPKASNYTLSTIEQDIADKQKGRSTNSTPAKPGAYAAAVVVSSGSGSSELRGPEADILAKQHGRSSHTNISSIDQDIAAKQMGRSTSTIPDKPGAYADTSIVSSDTGRLKLGGVEADILAKQRGRLSNTNISFIDQDIAAKQKGRSTSTKPVNQGAYAAVSSFEADILAKQRGSSYNISSSAIEQDVAAKQKEGVTEKMTATPGAFVATNIVSDDTDSPDLRGFDADALAKQRGSIFLGNCSTIDQDVAAKQQGRSTVKTQAAQGVFNATYRVSNDNDTSDQRGFVSDVLAKQRVNSYNPSSSTIDQGIATKQLGRSVARALASPGAHVATSLSCSDSDSTNPRDVKQDVLAKQNSRLIPPGSDIGLTTMNILERDIIGSRQIFNDRNDIDTTASELLELDADFAANRAALASFSSPLSHAGPNDATKEMKHNILSLISEEDNKGIVLDSPSKQTRGTVQKGACIDENSVSNSYSKNETSQSAFQDENLQGLEYGEYGRDDDEGLAVAFAVDDDDADMYLPSAVEFDPDAKPPMYRNRRFRLYVCLMIAAAVVGAFGAALGIVLTPQEPPPESVPYRLTLGIRENLALIISPDQLDDFTSPYKKALDWITFTDPLALTPDSSRFMNRFVLAYLYYATSQKKPWISDCSPSEFEGEDCVNAFFKDDGDGPLFTNKTSFRWLTAIDECDWAGIGCDSFDQIRSISLSYVGMTGTFPEGLTLLPYLQRIDFRYGEMEGSLPTYLNRWKNLVHIGLEYHLFSGALPESWFESRSWQSVLAPGNQISGKFSSNFSKLEDVVDLNMAFNKLTGSIPSELGNMGNLVYFILDSNALSGPIPTTIGKLSTTLALRFHGNSLTGTIPEEVGDCTELEDLYLSSNLLTGRIPDHVWDLSNLFTLSVADNVLTGSISNQLSRMSDLDKIDVTNNQFTGSIPFRLGNTDIRSILASGNRFNGTVAQGLCDLVVEGQIDVFKLDCAAPLGEVPEIVCPEDCCTVCCNRDGEDCAEL